MLRRTTLLAALLLAGCHKVTEPSRLEITPSIVTMRQADFVTFKVTGGMPPYKYTVHVSVGDNSYDLTSCIGRLDEQSIGTLKFWLLTDGSCQQYLRGYRSAYLLVKDNDSNQVQADLVIQ